MKRIDKMFADLQKLYSKRSALDTQIQGLEASLIAEVKAASRPAPAVEPAKKAAAEKKPSKQSAPAKKPAKK